jgi:hypothetical protein
MAEKDWDPKKTWTLVPVKQLFSWGKFAPYKDTKLQLRLHMINQLMFDAWFSKNPIPIFVSHRWDTPDTPDPTGKQFHIVMRFLVEAICLSKGICERFFSYTEPEIVLNPGLMERIQNHRADLLKGLREMEEFKKYQRPGPLGLPMEVLLSRWLLENFPALTFEVDEIVTIASVLRDVAVWYDYSSLPQKPYASKDEEAYFAWALKHLEHLIPGCHVVAIWDKPAINRAWCLLEGLIAEALQNGSYDASPNTTWFNGSWGIANFNLDPKYKNQHPNKQMAHYVRNLKQTFVGMEPGRIVEYFRANDIQCTKEEDLAVVAGILNRFLSQNK